MAMKNGGELRFEFGRNWSGFVRRDFDAERLAIAKKHLLDFVGRETLEDYDFLDIGCGSGIHSAAAVSAGARKVRSFDYDPNSVAASTMVWEKTGKLAHWVISRGDILDDKFVAALGQWNFVYSWGVLHHTGDVWRAIENAAKAVARDGLFYIALYAADVQSDTEFWLRIKKEYNQASSWKRRRMVWWYVWVFMMGRDWRKWREVVSRFIKHRATRGMSMFVDIRDWLGGWPMEFTYDADVIKYLEDRGFAKINIKTGEACTEFLFVKRS
jgi:2-polyprenyl-6-hydroxyphenyl methylase/3-demethylubiquinone-9 3-methyltransferase